MALEGIPIYLRHINDERGPLLGSASANDLDDLPKILQKWGVEGEFPEVTGEFILNPVGFELVVHDD